MRRPFYYIAAILPDSILPILIRHTGKNLCSVFYHMVSDADELHVNKRYKYRTQADFEADIDFLLRYFKPVTWQEAKDYHDDKPAILITFDDGFRCFYEVVAPILKSRGIPSVCFVNSDFVDNKSLMKNCCLSLAQNGITDVSNYLKTNRPYMTREQIKELYAQGIAIGAHSTNHPHFEDIDQQEQIRQISESLRFIQQECGIKERLFAFPYGQQGATESTLLWASQHCDLAMGTSNLQTDQHGLINRIWMEGYHISARNIIIGEYLREWLRQIR